MEFPVLMPTCLELIRPRIARACIRLASVRASAARGPACGGWTARRDDFVPSPARDWSTRVAGMGQRSCGPSGAPRVLGGRPDEGREYWGGAPMRMAVRPRQVRVSGGVTFRGRASSMLVKDGRNKLSSSTV
jgi:hypothetical protein